MIERVLKASAIAVAAGMAFSACSGGGMGSNGTGALPNALVMSPSNGKPHNACGAAQTGSYDFGGKCGSAQISYGGGHGTIRPYAGYSVKGSFGTNNATSRVVLVLRDATGNGDITPIGSAAAWTGIPSSSGTAFLYLAVTNTSSSAVTFNATPGIIVTNMKHGGFPGTSCEIYELATSSAGSSWTATGITGTPKSVGKRGMSRLTFSSLPVTFSLGGTTYLGFACT